MKGPKEWQVDMHVLVTLLLFVPFDGVRCVRLFTLKAGKEEKD